MADYSQMPHSVGCCGEMRSLFAYQSHVTDVHGLVKSTMQSAGRMYLNKLHGEGVLDDDHYHHLWTQIGEMKL